jgi:hypothetical protein
MLRTKFVAGAFKGDVFDMMGKLEKIYFKWLKIRLSSYARVCNFVAAFL